MILGASFDSVEESRQFADEQEFGFRLLSDTDGLTGRAYGVARPVGDQYASFARRFSYLINPDGLIVRVYDVADVKGHAEDVLADLKRLQGAQ